jgi:hypothetical protein
MADEKVSREKMLCYVQLCGWKQVVDWENNVWNDDLNQFIPGPPVFRWQRTEFGRPMDLKEAYEYLVQSNG